MRQTQWLAVACVGLTLTWGQAAWAIVIRADRTDSQYVTLGANVAYAGVGRFDGTTSNSSFIASGTLIAPDWVLTAAHVVDQATSLKFTVGGSTYTGNSWTAYTGWTGNLMAGYDIGLVHLNSSANAKAATLYTGSAEFGQTATFVGYGMTGTGQTGATRLDGKKRAAQNVIDGMQNSRLFLSDFDNPNSRRDSMFGSSTPLNLEGLIAPGDSGGGVFITTSAGTFLAGVNSFGAAWDGRVNSDYGDVAGYTRVSAFYAWINSVIGGTFPLTASGALSVTGTAKAFLGEPVPEPATLGLLLSAALGFLLWRRVGRR
jgi:hypothetical protein